LPQCQHDVDADSVKRMRDAFDPGDGDHWGQLGIEIAEIFRRRRAYKKCGEDYCGDKERYPPPPPPPPPPPQSSPPCVFADNNVCPTLCTNGISTQICYQCVPYFAYCCPVGLPQVYCPNGSQCCADGRCAPTC
jgi:hypothetical protein